MRLATASETPVLIVGAGIGGLVLALELYDAGIPCRVYEAATEIRPLGVGINVLPHASQVLARHGLEDALSRVAVLTQESVFFNRFGQLIYREPSGRFAGYKHPQYSIHRGDLQQVLLDAVRDRLGADAVVLDHECTGVRQDEQGADVGFRRTSTGEQLPAVRADVVVGCDGVHSVLRKQFHPDEGEPRYSGLNMWRGVTVHQPILTGASMIRAGWFDRGKVVIYPIRDNVDGQGGQLVNWVVEIATPQHESRDWGRRGRLEDFIDAFADWHFDWLDVPELFRSAEAVLEYPMVDQEPVDRWTFGRVTLLGDAAHPMVPRGSNGAGQAILDGPALRRALVEHADPAVGLRAYEAQRLAATSEVVRTNRKNPPDVILREVWQRTGDRPFERIEDVVTEAELAAISQRYKDIAGYSKRALEADA